MSRIKRILFSAAIGVGVFVAVILIMRPMTSSASLHADVPVWDIQKLIDEAKSPGSQQLTATEREVLREALTAAAQCKGKTIRERAVSAHDWIASHTVYDERYLDALSDVPASSSTPEGPFLTGTAVCYGYASAYELLCGLLDVPCEVIYGANGSGQPHAWNKTSEGYVDVCWDDTQSVPDMWLLKDGFFFWVTGHVPSE